MEQTPAPIRIDLASSFTAINPANGHIYNEYNAVVFYAADRRLIQALRAYKDACAVLGADANHILSIELLIDRVRLFQDKGGPDESNIIDRKFITKARLRINNQCFNQVSTIVFCAKDKALPALINEYINMEIINNQPNYDSTQSLKDLLDRVLFYQENIEAKVPDTNIAEEIQRCIHGVGVDNNSYDVTRSLAEEVADDCERFNNWVNDNDDDYHERIGEIHNNALMRLKYEYLISLGNATVNGYNKGFIAKLITIYEIIDNEMIKRKLVFNVNRLSYNYSKEQPMAAGAIKIKSHLEKSTNLNSKGDKTMAVNEKHTQAEQNISTQKTLDNYDVSGVSKNVPDIQVFGNGDLFQLLSKASSKSEGWMKSTKAMPILSPSSCIGCVVQVTTQQRNPDGSYSVAEALTFVPGAEITTDKYGNNMLTCSRPQKSIID